MPKLTTITDIHLQCRDYIRACYPKILSGLGFHGASTGLAGMNEDTATYTSSECSCKRKKTGKEGLGYEASSTSCSNCCLGL